MKHFWHLARGCAALRKEKSRGAYFFWVALAAS
ncbi:hypothetical protein ACSSV1_003536 [Labrenzia sp. MBR-25]|jgi:hypothetical protein